MNNIHVDELSDDDVAASRNDGQKQRGFEKSKYGFVLIYAL